MAAERRKIPTGVLEFLSIAFGVGAAFVYFILVIPAAAEYVGRYFIAAGAIYLISRLPALWYFRRRLLPPLIAYKRARRRGKVPSAQELRDLYLHLASYLPRSAMAGGVIWIFCAAMLVGADRLWMVGTVLSATTLLFTGLIIAAISLSLSYFINKARLEPLMEELQLLMGQTPATDRWRIPLWAKFAVLIFGMNTLAFLSFGVLLYSQMAKAIQTGALSGASARLEAAAKALESSPRQDWEGALAQVREAGCVAALVDARGTVLQETGEGYFGPGTRMEKWFKTTGAHRRPVQRLATPLGWTRILPAGQGLTMAVCPHPSLTSPSKMFSIFTVGFGYLVASLLILGLFIALFGKDLSRITDKINRFSRQLAEGDLRAVVPAWSDEELGAVAGNLRKAFLGLRGLTLEVTQSAKMLDEEVRRLVGTSQDLQRQVSLQTQSLEATRGSIRATMESVVQVSQSMGQVVDSTQEVSSTILEMQASVEEIAGNADVLTQSVEQTSGSSGQIAASSEEVQKSSRQLEQNLHEAVSFFAELDASLEETRRNAGALVEGALQASAEAQEGRERVREAGEKILLTWSAVEEGRQLLAGLTVALDRLGSIVDVIQDITEQTNLLSLNASIIAAGAGEHGKAFGVVAGQIRELSARTAGKAKEIRELIQTLRETGLSVAVAMDRTFKVADESRGLAGSAEGALRSILGVTGTQEERSRLVSDATEELAAGGRSASQAVARFFEMIQAISRALEEQVSATRLLNRESEKVRDVAFQLRHATEEQAKGAGVISEAVGRISADSQRTSSAMQEQARGATSMSESVEKLAEAARAIEAAFQELGMATARLQQSAGRLNREISAFRL
jgi:methyl-accepting chemotaxis protein